MINFKVVRIAGTPAVSGSQGDSTSLADGQTPIPGLRVQVQAEIQTTPIAQYEILTDKDGEPVSPIEVVSSSEVVIQSLDEAIAKFAASGPASEFAMPLAPAIVATPMVDQAGACRGTVEGTPIVQFSFNSLNGSGINALVPITGLSPDLYRTPNSIEDDLLLNSIRSGDGDVIPDIGDRATKPEENKQVFTPGLGNFTVPYDMVSGPLTWRFIGAETVVDGTTALCEEDGSIRCDELSPELVEQLVTELRGTVTATLRAAARLMKLGRSPYLRSTATAIRTIKQQVEPLMNAYVCPQGVALPSGCNKIKFPADSIYKTHAGIFSKPSPVKPKVFEKLAKSYNARYRRFIERSFPSEVVICTKK
jgi:hypothetical protein